MGFARRNPSYVDLPDNVVAPRVRCAYPGYMKAVIPVHEIRHPGEGRDPGP